MKKAKAFLIVSVILSVISITGIWYWYGWKLMLCLFFFEWGRNAYKKFMKQKEEVEDEELGEIIKQVFKK